MNETTTTNPPPRDTGTAERAPAAGQAPTGDLVLAAGPDEVRYRPDDALSACVGCAFTSTETRVRRRGFVAGMKEPVPLYGYYAYDCVPPSPPCRWPSPTFSSPMR